MTNWQRLVWRLETEVDWACVDTEALAHVSVILGELSDVRRAVSEVIRDIVRDRERLSRFLPHVEYPRPGWDKFILHLDAADRFRIRLHRFKPASQTAVGDNTLHDHRWPFCSYILLGSYQEWRFDVTHCDETTGAADLRLAGHIVHRPGSINSCLPGVPHRTRNDETCVTLFVRGSSVLQYSRVFDPDRQSFHREYGLLDIVGDEMSALSGMLATHAQC